MIMSKIKYVFGQRTLAELGRGHLILSRGFSGFWDSIALACVCLWLCLCVYVCMCLSVCVQTAGFWRERIAEQFCSAQLLSAAPAVPPATAQKYTATKIQKNTSQQQRNHIWKIYWKVGSHSNMTSPWAIVADQWLEQEKFQEVRQPWMEKSFETKFKKWLSKWPARLWERTATQASLEMIGWVG